MSNLIETKKVNVTKKREINWANVWYLLDLLL